MVGVQSKVTWYWRLRPVGDAAAVDQAGASLGAAAGAVGAGAWVRVEG